MQPQALPDQAAFLYLDLLKQCLTRSLFPEAVRPVTMSPTARHNRVARAAYSVAKPLLSALHLELSLAYEPRLRREGRDWPLDGETMIGLMRLQNLQDCVLRVLQKGVPGDFIETGAWRGGACIFMRAVLKACDVRQRIVWVADSFQGLPPPDGRYTQDEGDRHWRYSDVLGVSLQQVKSNFARYGLLDDQVRFLEGWFKDTLPSAPIGQLAVLRLDGDMYSSTMDALESLYTKVSPGGFTIVDDYGAVPACRKAVSDFRERYGIHEPIQDIDGSGVFWEKQ